MDDIYYYSNTGCLKIGNETSQFQLLNGKGEGSYWIKLCSKKDKIKKDGYDFVASISGDNIYIYESDDNNVKIKKLDNNIYYVYIKRGNIIIESQL